MSHFPILLAPIATARQLQAMVSNDSPELLILDAKELSISAAAK